MLATAPTLMRYNQIVLITEQNGHIVPKRCVCSAERSAQKGDVSERQTEGRGGSAGRRFEQPRQQTRQAEPAARRVHKRAKISSQAGTYQLVLTAYCVFLIFCVVLAGIPLSIHSYGF